MSNKNEKRVVLRSEPVDIKTKLKIMREFKEKTKEEIKGNTVYKGYNLGIWQLNLRNKYLHGKLNISEELEREFTQIGVLGERKRAKQTTDLEKYQMFVEFHKENPNAKIETKTVDKHGNPIGELRNWLQLKINKGTSELTEEQISQLRQYKYLRAKKDEIEQLCKKYKISSALAKEILQMHDTIDEFIEAYKQGTTKTRCNKINRRGIILSKNDLSIKQKQKYLWLIEDIFGEDILKENSKFIIEEDIQEALDKLSPKEKIIILERYDTSYPKRQSYENIGLKLNISGTRVKQLNRKAEIELSETLHIYDIDEQLDVGDELIRKLEKTNFEDWKMEKLNSDVSVLNTTELTIQTLKENGYNTLLSVKEADKKNLLSMRGIGVKKIHNVLTQIDNIIDSCAKENWENEKKQWKEQLDKIIINIESYFNAHEFYIKQEDIFTLNGTIPASIRDESHLEELKTKKTDKKIRLEELEDEIGSQDDKTKSLEEILDEKVNNKE